MKKNKKNKSVTIFLSIFAVIGIITITFLLSLLIFGENNNEPKESKYAYRFEQFHNEYNIDGNNTNNNDLISISCWPTQTAGNNLTKEILWETAECDLHLNKPMLFSEATFTYSIEGEIEDVIFYDPECQECVETDNNTVFVNRKKGTYKIKVNSNVHDVIAQFKIKIKWNYEYDKLHINIYDLTLSNILQSHKIDKIENTFDIAKEPYKKDSQ